MSPTNARDRSQAGAVGWWLFTERGLRVALPMATTQCGARGPFVPAAWTYDPGEVISWLKDGTLPSWVTEARA